MNAEVMTAEHSEWSEAMFRAIGQLCNRPAKMATLMALSTFPEGDFQSFAAISDRISDLQEDAHCVPVSELLIQDYCRRTLSEIGFVEIGDAPGKRLRSVIGARLTILGNTEGLSIAGAHGMLEISVPHGKFHARILGTSVMNAGRETNARPSAYRKLLEGPDGIDTIMREYSISRATLHDLNRLGVLRYVDLTDSANRLFDIGTPPKQFDSKFSLHTRAALLAAVALGEEGVHRITGQALTQRAIQINPTLLANDIWQAFRKWMSNNGGRSHFITDARPIKKGEPLTELHIAEEYRPYIAEFLRIRDLLADPGVEGEGFREVARAQADDIINSPRIITKLLGGDDEERQFDKKLDKKWDAAAEQFLRSIKAAEVDLVTLYSHMTTALSTHISYDHFFKRIRESTVLDLSYRKVAGRRNAVGYVSLLDTIFPANWRKRAACADIDPEFFFPTGTGEAAVKQADQAKKICETCPVRLACIKSAIEGREEWGVRGGIWLEKRHEELTPRLRRRLDYVEIKDRADSDGV